MRLLGAACLAVLLAFSCEGATVPAASTPPTIRGLPFSRAYTFDEIGYVPRGSRLDFDSFDRLAIVREGTMVVLNDDTWLNVQNESEIGVVRIQTDQKGEIYFGARGKWGRGSLVRGQTLKLKEFTSSDAPAWTRTAYFDNICCTRDGVYFGSWNGTVFWNTKNATNEYFELSGQTKLLQIRDRVYACGRDGVVMLLDNSNGPHTQKVRHYPIVGLVNHECRLGQDKVLLGFSDGALVEFDGEQMVPWSLEADALGKGKDLALAALQDEKIAVAVGGAGVFLFDLNGSLLESWTTTEFQQVSDIASNEIGVLWLMNEDSVEKVLYDSPLSKFDPKLGIRVRWPLLVSHLGEMYALSEGKLYLVRPSTPRCPSRLEEVRSHIPGGIWSMASKEEHMLVGSGDSVFDYQDRQETFLAKVAGLSHLMMPRAGLCYAVGSEEIAVFVYKEGKWLEAAPRVPGLGYGPIAKCSSDAVWVELASEGVAQVVYSETEGRLRTTVLKPWPASAWSNISVVGDTVMIAGKAGELLVLDDHSLRPIKDPKLQAIFETTKPEIVRLVRDNKQRLWASQRSGVTLFSETEGRLEKDDRSFNLLYDLFPQVQVTDSGDVWFSGQQSLFHVDKTAAAHRLIQQKPTVISITDGRTGRDLAQSWNTKTSSYQLNADENNLSLRIFSGTYADRAPPIYEYQMGDEAWTRIDSGSLLSLRGIEAGAHLLRIRLGKGPQGADVISELRIDIAPHWYRSGLAFMVYPLVAGFICFGLVHWSSYNAKRRNLVLASLVEEQTQQLKETMNRLNDETRLAATLAERDRISGEVHDSLQQGLSGAILQLDSTVKVAPNVPELRSRLAVVRNMLSFTRNEVQHVLWNQESLFLENGGLVEAIHKMAALINSGDVPLSVVVDGPPRDFDSTTKLHLLRIAQEASTNAVRHSGAREIRIHMQFLSERFRMTIADNGRGFVVHNALAESGGHFGLRSLSSRAQKVSGSLRIESSPGSGTTVTFEMEYGNAHPL